MHNKLETVKMWFAGFVGGGGVVLPNLEQTSQFFTGITPIVSFFVVLIPTGIWAWSRAIEALRGEDKS